MSPLSLGVAGTTAVTPRAALPSLRVRSYGVTERGWEGAASETLGAALSRGPASGWHCVPTPAGSGPTKDRTA